MIFYNFDAKWNFKNNNEYGLIFGFYGGRVPNFQFENYPFYPDYKWVYSLRIFLILFKVEINWVSK